MKYLAYEEDGKLVVTPLSAFMSIIQSHSSKEFIVKKNVPKGNPYLWLNGDELPNSRYRNAWKFNDAKTKIVLVENIAVEIAKRYTIFALDQYIGLKMRDEMGKPVEMNKKQTKDHQLQVAKIENCNSLKILENIEKNFRTLTR